MQSRDRYTDGTYLDETGDWHESDSLWKAERIARILSVVGASPKTVVDIGCGAGAVLDHLSKLVPSADRLVGYDISPQAIAIANRKSSARLSYFNANIFTAFGDPYDLVLAIDVFEHVEDYMGFLRRMRTLGKLFVFHIPLDVSALSVFREWPILRRRKTVGHLHYFIKETALETLRDCGYIIKYHFYTESGFFPEDKSLKARIRDFPCRTLFRVNPDLAVRIFGGYSLMVGASPVIQEVDE